LEIIFGILSIAIAIAANVIATAADDIAIAADANNVARDVYILTYISAGIWCGFLVSKCTFFQTCQMH